MNPKHFLAGTCPRCGGVRKDENGRWEVTFKWVSQEYVCCVCGLVWVERVANNCLHDDLTTEAAGSAECLGCGAWKPSEVTK